MKKRGFTIVELVMTIGLLGVLVGLLAPWMINAVKSYDLVSTRRIMLGQVRSGFERMLREIRLIPGQAQVITTSANSFTFQYPAGTAITYSLSGTNLMRNNDVLMNNVTALAFTYYDQSGTTTTTPASVRSVTMQVTAIATDPTAPYTVRTRIFLRNTGNYYTNFTSP